MSDVMVNGFLFRQLIKEEIALATTLLEQASLVTADLSEKVQLYGLFNKDGKLLALGGLEVFDRVGLLRSVCVAEQKRHAGLGKEVVQRLEHISRDSEIEELFLLTTTAKDFFSKLHYELYDRENVPSSIKSTPEFSSLCPSSASLMHKKLRIPVSGG